MSAAIKAVAAKTAKMTACALASGLAASLSAASLAQTSEGAHAPRWQLNMPEGVTALSREVYELHMLVFWVCVAIGVLVYGLMAVSMVLHRRARGVKPAQFHDSLRLELLWTIVPAGILVALFIPSMVTLAKIYDNSDSDLDILVTGYQWKWEYHYLGDDNDFKFLSTLRTSDSEMRGKTPKGEYYLLDVDKPLVIPVHKKVRFLITAKDVLHAWWVPDFAVKQDAIPGFINEAWVRVDTPGVYRGQCTELCGKDHGFMPIVVHVVPQDEFIAWRDHQRVAAERERALVDQRFSLTELVERGRGVYETHCASCHLPTGLGIPGAFPALTAGSLSTGPLNEHLDVVVNGKAGTAMQAFGSQLGEADLAAVITYERNAWGNNMGDMLQPIDVARSMRQ